ncbi:MAG: LamB/YcsF family protein [Jatrophihabitantaceae bacterium]
MQTAISIDLNADLGEGFGAWRMGDDEALLDVITSANVACGFHAGDPVTMARVCAAAARRGVAIGAQVGYRDLAGFGRRRMDVAADDLAADVLYQLGALDAFATVAGTRVRYLKPHGALYNTAADDPVQARAIVAAVARYDSLLPVLGLPGSALESAAGEAGVPFVAEAFADRAYTAGGRLVPRGSPGAVHDSADEVVAQALALVRDGTVTALDGTTVAVRAASLCLHGDTPGAAALARAVRDALTTGGVTLATFVP